MSHLLIIYIASCKKLFYLKPEESIKIIYLFDCLLFPNVLSIVALSPWHWCIICCCHNNLVGFYAKQSENSVSIESIWKWRKIFKIHPSGISPCSGYPVMTECVPFFKVPWCTPVPLLVWGVCFQVSHSGLPTLLFISWGSLFQPLKFVFVPSSLTSSKLLFYLIS